MFTEVHCEWLLLTGNSYDAISIVAGFVWHLIYCSPSNNAIGTVVLFCYRSLHNCSTNTGQIARKVARKLVRFTKRMVDTGCFLASAQTLCGATSVPPIQKRFAQTRTKNARSCAVRCTPVLSISYHIKVFKMEIVHSVAHLETKLFHLCESGAVRHSAALCACCCKTVTISNPTY